MDNIFHNIYCGKAFHCLSLSCVEAIAHGRNFRECNLSSNPTPGFLVFQLLFTLQAPFLAQTVKNLLQRRRSRFDLWVGGSPGEGMATEFHGQRSLAGYSLWGCKESATTTSPLTHTFFLILLDSAIFKWFVSFRYARCIREWWYLWVINYHLFILSLGNPMDIGNELATVHGVAESQTQLSVHRRAYYWLDMSYMEGVATQKVSTIRLLNLTII